MKKNLSILLGVAAMVAVISAAFLFRTAPAFDRALRYESPVAGEADAEVETPRDRALRERAEAQAVADAEQPYEEAKYRAVPKIGSRVAIWIVAQLHLLFAAFVLAVPIFALIIEFIGYRTGDKRYDKLAYEFTKLLSASFAFTATLG
ncbi:MAG: cytochrome ubiquinol oxidase subunit I, partial [Thermoanaerobaculia bacterium]